MARSSIRDSGRIFDACTMAESRPASTHSCRNTELSTCRAAGLRPKDTFDNPRIVDTPGSSDLIERMPSIVSTPSSRLSSIPVDSGSANASNMRSSGASP